MKLSRQLLKDVFIVVLLASMLASALFLGLVKPYLDKVVNELEHENWQQVEPRELEAMYYNNESKQFELVEVR